MHLYNACMHACVCAHTHTHTRRPLWTCWHTAWGQTGRCGRSTGVSARRQQHSSARYLSIPLNTPQYPSISVDFPQSPPISTNVPQYPLIPLNIPSFPSISPDLPQEVLRRGDFDYAVHALAAFAFSPVLEDGKVQYSTPGQATGSWLCAPAALLAVLLLCRGGVRGGGSGDENEIARQVSKLVKCSSRSVVHVLSQEAQDKTGKSAPSHRAGVLFVEKLVQECQVCFCLVVQCLVRTAVSSGACSACVRACVFFWFVVQQERCDDSTRNLVPSDHSYYQPTPPHTPPPPLRHLPTPACRRFHHLRGVRESQTCSRRLCTWRLARVAVPVRPEVSILDSLEHKIELFARALSPNQPSASPDPRALHSHSCGGGGGGGKFIQG